MREKGKKEGLKIVPVKLPMKMLDQIDDLIKLGKYVNRSEFIRNAIRKELTRAKREIRRGKK